MHPSIIASNMPSHHMMPQAFGQISSIHTNKTMIAMTLNSAATVSQNNRIVELRSSRNGYGVAFTSVGSTIERVINHFVSNVKPGSPASKAGLCNGDRVLQVDGIATYTMNHAMFTAMLRSAVHEQRPVRLTLGPQELVPEAVQASEYRAKEVVSALYQEDGKWYNATVTEVFGERKTISLVYNGFENEGSYELDIGCIRKLNGEEDALPPYWIIAYTDASKEKYYYNTLTNEARWDKPGSSEEDELASIPMDSWAREQVPEEQVAYFDRKAFHTAFKLIVYPEGEPEFEIDAGSCEFGGTVPASGIDLNLHYDSNNPMGFQPMNEPPQDQLANDSMIGFLVERGEIPVSHKALAAQDAGASCFILINNDDTEALFNVGPPGDGSELQVRIPVTNISYLDGLDLIAAFAEGVKVSAKLVPIIPTAQVDDSDLPFLSTTVKIKKLGRKLGVKVGCLQGNAYITAINPDGAVAKVGRVTEGALIISVNGTQVSGKAKDEILELLKGDAVTIEVNNTVTFAEMKEQVELETRVPMQDITGFSLSDIGRDCIVNNYGNGKIQWIGLHAVKKKERIGIVLAEANGKNNGTVGEDVYFACDDKYGVLVPPKSVVLSQATAPHVPLPDAEKPILKRSDSEASGCRVSFSDDDQLQKVFAYDQEPPVLDGPGSPYKVNSDFNSGNPGDLVVKSGDIVLINDDEVRDAGDELDTMVFGTTRDGSQDGRIPLTFVSKVGDSNGPSSSGPTLNLFSFGGMGDAGDIDDDADDMVTIGGDDSTDSATSTTIEIVKQPGKKIGLTFKPHNEWTLKGVIINAIKPGGLAIEHGGFESGDQIMAINGHDTTMLTKKELLAIIKGVGESEPVSFTIAKPTCIYAQLVKEDGRKLGMSFHETEHGCTIKSINPNGIAASNGRITVGMLVASVNDKDVVGSTKATVLGLIKASNPVNLELHPQSDSSKSVPTHSDPGTPKILSVAEAEPVESQAPVLGNTPDDAKLEAMGRLEIIKWLRSNNIEYKHVGKDIDALRSLVRGTRARSSEKTVTESRKQPMKAKVVDVTGFSVADIGKRVVVKTKNVQGEGTLRFVGRHLVNDQERIGVELDDPIGKNNGTLNDGQHTYFACKDKYGLLVSPGKASLIQQGDQVPQNSAGDYTVAGENRDAMDQKHDATVVEFSKQGRKIGISLNTSGTQVYLTKVDPEGAAASTGKITVGLALLKINGEDCATLDKSDAVQLLRQAGEHITLHVREDSEGFAKWQAAKVERKAAKTASKVDQPTSIKVDVPENNGQADSSAFASMGRLALIKHLRAKGVDYKSAGKDLDALRELAMSSSASAVSTTMGSASKTSDTASPNLSQILAPQDATQTLGNSDTGEDAPFTIKMVVPEGKKIGMSLDERPGKGVFISKINPVGMAATFDQIKVGLQIVRVNETSVLGATKAFCLQLIKSNKRYTTFTFASEAAASKLNAEESDSFSVRVQKEDGRKLGMSFEERPESGVWVTRINPNGIAAETPGCTSGVRVMSVNGTDCRSMSKPEVIALIKENPFYVDFTFSETK